MRLRLKGYLRCRVPYSTNGISSFQLEKILSCGDISRNPGPKGTIKEPTVKFPCSECKKSVKSNQDAILLFTSLESKGCPDLQLKQLSEEV